MEKINIAELLKDCPSGMELECTIFEDVILSDISKSGTHPICIEIKSGVTIKLTKYGQLLEGGKCVIFPKGKTTWEGFEPPCQFTEGDIIYIRSFTNELWVSIYKQTQDDLLFTFVDIKLNDNSFFTDSSLSLCKTNEIVEQRIATEEEKSKLFRAIKENGYHWNAETKTLEKLVKPKFKVGDRVRHKKNKKQRIITKIHQDCYECDNRYILMFSKQDNYELVPNKFDITTLKAFESRVLVRSTNDDIWRPAIYGFADSDRYYVVGGIYWKQCIPYEVNKELLDTTNDCDDYYKTWEE